MPCLLNAIPKIGESFLRLSICLSTALLFVSYSSLGNAASDCERLLQFGVYKRALNYRLHTASPVRIRPDRPGFPVNTQGGPVVSFGSGPDVLTPLMLAPNAGEIHLVDILAGWGLGPGEVVFELQRRLQHVHENAVVEVVNPGFTRFFNLESLRPPEGISSWSGDHQRVELLRKHFAYPIAFLEAEEKPENVAPLILKVTWPGDDGIQWQKTVFLHPINFNYSPHLEFLNRYLHAPLSAIVITGSYWPKTLEQFVGKLAPGGQLVIELYRHSWRKNKRLMRRLQRFGNLELLPAEFIQFKTAPASRIYLLQVRDPSSN